MANPVAQAAAPILPTTSCQPLSIRRLSTQRIEQILTKEEKEHIKTLTPQAKLTHLCKRVMGVVNVKLQEKGFNPVSNGEDVELKGLFEPTVQKEAVGNGFHFLFYTRQITTLSQLAESILQLGGERSKMQTARVEMIGFLYRQHAYTNDAGKKECRDDIYALTTSDAWRKIAYYTDFTFPQAILMRLLDTKVQSIVYQELVGNVLRTDKDFKKEEKLSPTKYFDRFITQLSSRIRPYASIYRLQAFCNKGNTLPKKDTQVKIEMGAIRFQKELALADYPPLLDLLSKVCHHEKTYQVKADAKQKIIEDLGPEEKDEDDLAFWKYVQPVDPTETAALEKLMDEAIWRTFHEGAHLPLFFSHRLVKDFVTSSRFRLVSRLIPKNKQQEYTWDSPKSAQEILDLLRTIEAFKKCQDSTEFAKLLGQIKLEFKIREKKETCSLRKLFGGEIRISETQKSYFLMHGLWLSLSHEYLRIVNAEFRGLLKDCLMISSNPHRLTHPWPTKEEIEENKKEKKCLYAEDLYNRSYLKVPHFLVGDRVCVEEVELFDLFRLISSGTEQQTILYHVKKGFGQSTRDAASQIYVSMSLVHDLLINSNEKKETRLDELCKALEGKYPGYLEKKIGGEKALRSAFKREQITYVYAVYDDSPSGRSLEDELQRKEQLTSSDFIKLEDKKKVVKPEAIIAGLNAAEYLTEDGFLTPKFRRETKEQFKKTMSAELGCTQVLAENLHNQISKLAVSPYDSLIARLELIKLRREVEKKEMKFMISQIPRSKDHKDEEGEEVASLTDVLKSQSLPTLNTTQPLGEGAIFSLENEHYQMQDTVGDGTCGLHAAFGDLIKERYFCAGGAQLARQKFADELRGCLNAIDAHPRGDAVQEAYQRLILDLLIQIGAQGANGKALAAKLGAKSSHFKQRAKEEDEKQKLHSKKLVDSFVDTFSKMKEKNAKKFPALMAILGAGLTDDEKQARADQYAANVEQLKEAFHQHRVALHNFFCQPNFPSTYEKPKTHFQAIDQANAALQALHQEIYNDQDVFDAYIACINDLEYWFQTDEVCLAGLLRGQGLRIFRQNVNGEITIADRILDEGNDFRALFHRGNHFMRCTTQDL